MMDKKVCDRKFPFRWRSSLSIFHYEPPVEQQSVEGMTVSYLKVSCTITGYQVDGKEVGLDRRVLDRIWSASPEPINLLEDTVDKYYPCYGAILEVAVAPQIVPQGIKVLFPADYPYFADFQPKKRELYEMVTETGEKMSRTLEQLNVKKGMTSSQSHEVYDETTVGVKAGVSTATGIGPTGEVSYQNKSGTKDISQQEQSNVNTTDNSREMRENLSHTTNFTQMYSEFNSYHLRVLIEVYFLCFPVHILSKPKKKR